MTAENIKPFSKEWWLELATGDCRFIRDRRPWPSHWAILNQKQKGYCAKRYAQAYHREKIRQEEDGNFMLATQKGQAIGKAEEQNRILGIIEQLSFYDDIEKAHILIEMELIEKIKG